MYESLIEVSTKKLKEIYDDGVVNVVHQLGFNVNCEELAKALAYDRGQYELGYKDGKDDAVRHGHWIKHGRIAKCSCCNDWLEVGPMPSNIINLAYHFCPNCGAAMDEDEEVQE